MYYDHKSDTDKAVSVACPVDGRDCREFKIVFDRYDDIIKIKILIQGDTKEKVNGVDW